MDNLHHTTIAHFRRAMLIEESTFDTPPIVDFSFYADRTHDMSVEHVGFEEEYSSSSNFAHGRDTATSVREHVLRTLHSSDKIAECMQSIIREQTCTFIAS